VLIPRQTLILARWPTVSGAGPTRRRVLAAAATLSVAPAAALTGCTLPVRIPEVPDPLESPARRAEADATQASTVAQLASRADPVLAAAARALATDRRTHAATLRAELRRVRPSPAPHSPAPHGPDPHRPDPHRPDPHRPDPHRPDPHSTSPPVAPQPPTPELASARGALTEAVRAAHDEAAGLVMTLPGYRAALLASVAACCASHAALLS
jgi:hypothetical protein